MVGIYKITNIINGKSYIGQSINIDKRIKEHFYKASCQKDCSYNSILHSAIRKYGEANFKIEIVVECCTDKLDELEKYYIQEFNTLTPNGYNILAGGQQNRRVPNCCKDCGKQITRKATYCKSCAAKHQERKVENIPEKLELALMIKNDGFSKVGKYFGVSDSTIKKWCKSYGIPYLKDELISWYNLQIGIENIVSEQKEKINVKKQVQQIDINTGEVIAIYESARAAARALNKKNCSHITEVCNGKLEKIYGYKWRYI